jgi:hypothetical protein
MSLDHGTLYLKNQRLPGVVAYTCNPSTQEAVMEAIEFDSSLGDIERPCFKKIKQSTFKEFLVYSAASWYISLFFTFFFFSLQFWGTNPGS